MTSWGAVQKGNIKHHVHGGSAFSCCGARIFKLLTNKHEIASRDPCMNCQSMGCHQ